jgi:geranylgeranylglycerol-phosphate geranylgeranyltransferase
MRKLAGLVQLTRPLNMVICAASTIVGALLAAGPPLTIAATPPSGWGVRALAAAFSSALILAAGNAFNDVRDLDTDRINAPERPLPAGDVSPRAATVFAALLALVGCALAVVLGPVGVTVAISAVALLFCYDMFLKRVPFAGNLAVSLLGGLAVVYGGIAGLAVARTLIPAAFAVLLHLARELVKDAADEPGDRTAGINTVATMYGVHLAARLAKVVLVLLCHVIFIPYAKGYFGIGYLAVLIIGVMPPLVFAVWLLHYGTGSSRMIRASAALKIAMPVGIIAMLVGFQGW